MLNASGKVSLTSSWMCGTIGHQYTAIKERRTRLDWAGFTKDILDVKYTDAMKVALVMGNLKTHATSSFHKAFSPEETLRLAQRLKIFCTLKHGSWLNIAEVELSALAN
jgi:hypothetical protein